MGFALRRLIQSAVTCTLLFASACTPFEGKPTPGPDKQGSGMLTGAALGAGSGAVTGAQLSAGAGPGAFVGAGFGAVYGALQGIGVDLLEEDQLRRKDEEQCLRERAWVQEVLTEHYARRLALHPSRDIFPADLFFDSDSSKLKKQSRLLVREIARYARKRLPSSRLLVVAYVTSPDESSTYAESLSSGRAEEIALQFVQAGIEPRRMVARGVTLTEPLLIDPDDSPGRYRQAVEIVTMDR